MPQNERLDSSTNLSSQLGLWGKIDTGIYRLEIVIIVFALAAMSIAVFMDVAYQFGANLKQSFARGDAKAWLSVLIFLGFSALMAFTAAGSRDKTNHDAPPRSYGFRIGVTIAVIGGICGIGYSLLTFESTTVYRLLLIALLMPITRHFALNKQYLTGGGLIVLGGMGLYFLGDLPSGYSWAQSYGLFLLLWVGFLGASIAARERRHLRIDLARKVLPPKFIPHLNALSYFIAALFTAMICYLGFLYLFGHDSSYMRPIWDPAPWLPDTLQQELRNFPLPEDASLFRRILQVVFGPSEHGEIPDWLKVLAIPVSMGLIVLRFIGHTLVFARMAIRGESYLEQLGGH